jgi:hypothetical protein
MIERTRIWALLRGAEDTIMWQLDRGVATEIEKKSLGIWVLLSETGHNPLKTFCSDFVMRCNPKKKAAIQVRLFTLFRSF